LLQYQLLISPTLFSNFKHKKSSSIKRSFFLSTGGVSVAIGTNSTPLFIKKALMTLKKSLELKSTGGVPIAIGTNSTTLLNFKHKKKRIKQYFRGAVPIKQII